MAPFVYKATTFDGKIVEGTMDASDGGSVALKLQDMGLLPIQVGPAGSKTVLTREIEWPWKNRKIGRNKPWCESYRRRNQGEKNKARHLLKHLETHPKDQHALQALKRVEVYV